MKLAPRGTPTLLWRAAAGIQHAAAPTGRQQRHGGLRAVGGELAAGAPHAGCGMIASRCHEYLSSSFLVFKSCFINPGRPIEGAVFFSVQASR